MYATLYISCVILLVNGAQFIYRVTQWFGSVQVQNRGAVLMLTFMTDASFIMDF